MTIATWGDLLVKKEYKMTKPILQNRDYTLSVAGTMGRNSVVAMLGNDMVIGRLKNNTITFRITDFTEEDTIVLICPEGGSITHAQLERGNKATDWTPAPEDAQEYTENKVAEAKKYVDDLEIGGRNYFSLTHLNSISPSSWAVDNAYVYNFTLEPNKKYILSSNVPTDGDSSKNVLYFNGSGTSSNGAWSNNPRIMETDSNGKLFIAIPTGRTHTNGILNGTYWVQLEKGTKATDWTPAPEDVEASIGEVDDKATDAKDKTDAWSYDGTTEINGKSIKTGTFEANQITTGILKSQNDNSWLNLNDGEFNFASGGLVYSGGNLTLNGKLNVTNLEGAIPKNQLDSTTQSQITAGATANDSVADMMSDLKITPIEKTELLRSWERIKAEYAQLNSQATSLDVASAIRTRYTSAYNHLNTTAPRIQTDILASMTTNYNLTTATRDAFKSQMFSYFLQAETISKAITDKIQSNASSAQTTATDAQSRIGAVEGNINNAVTTIDNTGVTVKDGSFFLEDDVSSHKYSIVSLPNLIKDPTFSSVKNVDRYENPYYSSETVDEYSHYYYITGDPYTKTSEMDNGQYWLIFGTPLMYTDVQYLSGYTSPAVERIDKSRAQFEGGAVIVDSENQVWQNINEIKPNSTYTISAFIKTFDVTKTTRAAVEIFSNYFDIISGDVTGSGVRITFGSNSSRAGEYQRVSATFKTASMKSTYVGVRDYGDISVYLTSNNSNKIIFERIQLVEASYPTQFISDADYVKLVSGQEVSNLHANTLIGGNIHAMHGMNVSAGAQYEMNWQSGFGGIREVLTLARADISGDIVMGEVDTGGTGMAGHNIITKPNLHASGGLQFTMIAIPSGANLNHYTTAGFYYCTANVRSKTLINRAHDDAGALVVYRHAGTKQIWYHYNSNNTWTRKEYSGTWTSWTQIHS